MAKIIGIIVAVLLCIVLLFSFKNFNAPTPDNDNGNESIEQYIQAGEAVGLNPIGTTEQAQLAMQYIEALGGMANIVSVDNNATTIDVEVVNANSINEANLKVLGATNVVCPDDTNVQITVGTNLEFLGDAIKDWLKNR